jgi:hypothetical protein
MYRITCNNQNLFLVFIIHVALNSNINLQLTGQGFHRGNCGHTPGVCLDAH